MHCGLTNARASFQRFMNEFFKDIPDVCVVVYLDDILILSGNPDEYLKHVREVLRRLRASGTYAKVEKCAFSVDTTDCLGSVIGPDATAFEWTRSKSYATGRHHEKVRTSNRPWVSQTSTDGSSPRTPISPSHWLGICARAPRESGLRNVRLSTPQNSLSSAHTLHDFDPSLPPVVKTDASDYAIAGVLSVRAQDGQAQPPAFFNRTLSGAEFNYGTHDKGLLAIFEAFKTWRHYLESRSIRSM